MKADVSNIINQKPGKTFVSLSSNSLQSRITHKEKLSGNAVYTSVYSKHKHPELWP